MADVTACLERYVREVIALAREDITDAVKSRRWFLGRLQKVIEARDNDLRLMPGDPFRLFGSYPKRTKVADVDEFDIMVRIDARGGIASSGGIPTGEGLGELADNPLFSDAYRLGDTSSVHSEKVLNWMKSVAAEVVKPYGGSVPERDGPSVRVEISSQSLAIDLVPGPTLRRYSDNMIHYAIPKGTNSSQWLFTAPEADRARLESAAERCDDLRNVVRICKRVKDTYNFQISSFAVETAVVTFAHHGAWYQDLYNDLVGAIDALRTSLSLGTISDPFDPKINLLDGLEQRALTWYAERLRRARGELAACISLDDDEKAYHRIRKALENE